MRLQRAPRVHIVTIVVIAAALVGGYLLFYYFFPAPSRVELSRRYEIRPGEKILIFAPHSDDETLAAAGLIQSALHAGADVNVILVTNGDGFTLAVEDEFHTLKVTPSRYVQLAYIRQSESLAALESLGVSPRKVYFLGFPDRGTAEIWERHWSPNHPFTSRFTRLSASPYTNSFTPGVVFAGANLASDIEYLLHSISPDTIILPHPNDTHPDHLGTHNFVMYALAELGELSSDEPAGTSHRPRLLNYLVHRGDWPAPKGAIFAERLLPPPRLTHLGIDWGIFPLTPAETSAKYRAILKYRSQVSVMRRYLISFARSNELFADTPVKRLAEKPGTFDEPGQTESQRWPDETIAIRDPVSDTMAREAQGEADIKIVRLALGTGGLAARVETRTSLTRAVHFIFHVHALPDRNLAEPPHFDLDIRYRGNRWEGVPVGRGWQHPNPISVELKNNGLEFVLPDGVLGAKGTIFVSVESWITNLRIDHTAWQVFSKK